MSWDDLYSIVRESVETLAESRRHPPEACPCGEPLTQGRNGTLRCQFDGWEWPRDANSAIR